MIKKIKEYLCHEEFYPSVFSLVFKKTYLCRKGLLNAIKQNKKFISGKVLDIGCGNKPYKKLFRVKEYIGIDIDNNPGHSHKNESIDKFYDGRTIPFQKDFFDSIVCFEVLEHVEDLDKTVSEISRVIKPEGFFLATTPFLWPLHEKPNDYRRLTSFGITKLFKKKGFSVVKIEKINNSFAMLFQINQFFLEEITNHFPRPVRIFSFPIIFLNNILGLSLSWIKTKNIYGGNLILLRKN